MINCNYYSINEHVFFCTVANEKQTRFRDILNRITNRVLASYDNYLSNFQLICAQALSEFDENTEEVERDTLQLCYSSSTASFNYFKAQIITNQPAALKTLCPYCMIDRPRTLDHYIGQSEFPEFSILTRNLVPCCWDCNNVKRAGWRDGINRRYINFYDDQFLIFPFLTGDLVVSPGDLIPSICFRLERPQEISLQEFAIIESHFLHLNLLEQYDLKANSRLSTEITTIKGYINDGMDDPDIQESLLSRFNEFATGFGINYWEAVVYKTLSDNLPLIHAL